MTSDEQIAGSEKARPSRRRRKRWVFFCAFGLGAAVFGAVLFLQSNFFQERVRRRLVTALEQATGGRVELREFSVEWSRLEVNLRGLVIHGQEGRQESPLFSAEWLQVHWRLLSVWNFRADLALVRLSQPKIHIAIYEDGSSNIPTLARPRSGEKHWVERVLELRVGRLEVLRGQFHWNQNQLPLDFRAEQFQVRLDYDAEKNRYTGELSYRNAVLALRDAMPLPSEGQVRFGLYSNRVEIESLAGQTAGSDLTLQGTVADFRAPQFHFQYDLHLDWKEAGELLRNRGWEGEIAWRGKGESNAAGWTLEGDLEVRTLQNGIAAWREVPWTARSFLRATRPAASADTSGSSGGTESPSWRAEFQKLEISALGGRLTGAAAVRPASPAPVTTLELEADRVSFPVLAKALTMLPVPLEQLQWSAALSGPVHASFSGLGKELVLTTDWEASPPPVIPPGFTPIAGRFRGSYQANQKRVESQASYVDLPKTRLAASGWFQEEDSGMRLTLDTTDVEENRTLAGFLWKDFNEIPFRLYGRATAAMWWSGGTKRPRLNGDFRLADVSYQETRWDAFSGRLDYQRGLGADPLELRTREGAARGDFRTGTAELAISSGQLRKAGSVLDFNLRMGLQDGDFAPASSFSFDGSVRNADLQTLQAIAGLQYPIQGTLDGSVNASGTRQNPTGSGAVTLTNGTIYEEPFDRLTAQLRLEPGRILFADAIRLQKGAATFQGELSVDQQKEQFRFAASGSGVRLEAFRTLQTARMPLAGLAEGRFSGEGTFERPQVKGEVEVRQFRLPGEQEGRLSLGVESRSGKAFWTLSGDVFGGKVRGTGETTLQDPYPLSATLNLEDAGLPPLVRVFREPPQGLQGIVKGTVRANGNWKDWRATTLHGELSSLEASREGVTVHNSEPLRFDYQNGEVRLEQLHLVGERVDLQVSGTVRMAEDPVMNLTAKGQMDLAALSKLDFQIATAGQLSLDAQLGGTFRRPLWRGRLLFSDGSVQIGNFPNSFTKINGTVVFDGNRGVLEGLTAESGGGPMELGGFVRYGEGAGWQFNVSAEPANVRVRYPAGLSTWVTGQLNWTGTVQSSLLEGRLVMNRQAVAPYFDLAQVLLTRQGDSAAPVVPAFLRNMRMNVDVFSGPEIRLDSLTARNLQTDVELRIQGTVEHPVWLGRIGILQGEIYFAGKRYTVNRGEISFLNPFRFEPLLNLSVQARVQKYDIAMEFSGPPDRLTVTYRSDPPLPARDILALLVAGSARETSLETSATQPLPQVGVDSLLSQALRSQIGSRLDRLFGTGRFRVDPQITGLGRSANASVALEQQVSDDFTVTYVTDVTSTQQQLIQAEWTISPRLSVVGIRDQNGLIGVNFQITLRFR